MGAEEVLRSAARLSALSLALLGAVPLSRAHAEEADDGLRRPERVTVGTKDQFLGQLSPDEQVLYFVSNRETRKEIYAQDSAHGHVRLAFDEGADVTWPRISPEGKSLLYISFRDQAAGELCVRDLPAGGNRRCLDGTPAVLQAEWIDSAHIALVGRTSIDGDLRMSEVSVAAKLSARTLFERNWTSPAISPDGRWLVYVPLDRVSQRIGPGFAARAAHRLEAVRLDGKGDSRPLALDVPGLSGQPAFSRDGRWLYFVQFFSDSNHDGVIDASDHGVLFRVAFASSSDDAPALAAAAEPVQLTDSGTNCQYPRPSASTLIATCSLGQTLDIYKLPLDGEIPADWTPERLRTEVELSERQSERLLLYRHALLRQTDPSKRRLIMMRLVMTHLELEEFDAAAFYAQKIATLRDAATRGLGRPLQVLVDHRRSQSSLERGRTVDTDAEQTAAQLARLRDDPTDSAAAQALNHIVRSEIVDWLGDKTKARTELEAAVIGDDTPRGTVEAYFARADALYRELDDRDALVAVCRRLATSPARAAEDRLDFARAATRALVRGRPRDEADAVLARERAAEPRDSELGFALDLARSVLGIVDEHPGRALKAQLMTLYESQKRLDRKRAIVLDAVQRAVEVGADSLIEALSEHYVDDVVPGTGERRSAERMYRRAIMGRAFRRLSKGHLAEARADFDAVFRRTDSLQAALGSIDLRLREGQSRATIEGELLRGRDRNAPVSHFVQAYLIARELPSLSGAAHAQAAADAQALLRASWPALKNKGTVHALSGAILHEEYLRTGALDAAEGANSRYMVAVQLLQDDPRSRALILGQLGLLQTQVGNYRIGLDYLEQREKLPYAQDAEALALREATALALLHSDREVDSAAMADKALAMLASSPALSPYRVLALDRAALDNLAAGRFARALTLYDEELPLLSHGDDRAARHNLFVVRLARAAAAIGAGQPGRAEVDLAALEPSLADPKFVASLASQGVTAEQAVRSYRSISAGLRANAELALGRLDQSAAALSRRRNAEAEQRASSNSDEDIQALTLVESRLANNARARADFPAAAQWLALALDHADSLVERTHASVDLDQLRVLWLGAELNTLDHAPITFDVYKRLSQAQAQLILQHDRAYRAYQRWFEIYLALMRPGATKAPSLRVEQVNRQVRSRASPGSSDW